MKRAALILAAGEGTRMKSDLPKVAHQILGVSMLELVVDAARTSGVDPLVVVTGHKSEIVEALLEGITACRQERQLGTGHAVMSARPFLGDFEGSLLVLSGDTPLLRPETIGMLMSEREHSGAAACMLTTRLSDPTGYGRIVRGGDATVSAVVEEKDCTPGQRAITEVNTGTYCFDARTLFEHLDRLSTDNAQGEYYLTDMVGIFADEGLGVDALITDDPAETLGVNSRVQLAEATKVLQRRINTAHMLAGVTMTDPDLVWVGPRVTLGRDVTIEPMTFLLGETSVGDGVTVGPSSRLTDCTVGADASIDSSVLRGVRVGPGATVGPMTFLRPGTELGPSAKAGAFVELKNTRVGENSKVPHLSYVGDAELGIGVNIGAGAITCNFDGRGKFRTRVGDGAFVGSDTMMVAPVEIGAGAVTGAGSVISGNVPDDALAVERNEMRIIEGWAAQRRARWDEGKGKAT
jgi:bifunctional UDP-N-acetylglucosamine pyrophosphorylase / glucosamine-1-phosphate N-acetyltransferase